MSQHEKFLEQSSKTARAEPPYLPLFSLNARLVQELTKGREEPQYQPAYQNVEGPGHILHLQGARGVLL